MGEEREAIKRRADVVRPLLRSISAWPWTSVKVEEEGFPCIPHPHFDFYVEAAELEVIEGRPGYLHAKADWNTPTRCINVGCYLGKEADADFIVSAPEMIRGLRDDVWSLLSALTAAELRAEAAERERDDYRKRLESVVGRNARTRLRALDEAAKVMCWMCKARMPIEPGFVEGEIWHRRTDDERGRLKTKCEAQPIITRSLASSVAPPPETET